jgi:copper chaperone
MEQTTFGISGMTCMGCVASVKKVLTGIPGVSKVEVTLKPGQALVEFDITKTGISQLTQAVEDAGYDVA